jgi:predicted nucleotidyltransferase component of viral defense system
MSYSEDYISNFGKQTGFINSNIEKVIRLLDVLAFIDSDLDPSHEKLVLKGGTAINLMITNLARLSVDIDLDYIGSLDKEKMGVDRDAIMSALDSFMLKEGYALSKEKSRGSVILASRSYSYTNAFGNRDNIKVEINFIDRIHVCPCIRKKVKYFDKEVMVQTPLEAELLGMKIAALIDRHKPRDLFDIYKLKGYMPNLDKDRVRKLAVFYLSLDGIFELNESSFDNVNKITQDSIKKELQPILAKGNVFDLKAAKEEVINFLKELLTLSDKENKYLEEFSKGNFDPYLLFEPNDAERAAKHPMAKWRAANLKK